MRISEACQATRLTERAIRLYIKEGLIAPRQRNGVLNLMQPELETLEQIAWLRKADFSIDQIRRMLHDSQAVLAVVDEKRAQIRARAEADEKLLDVLDGISQSTQSPIATIVERMKAVRCMDDQPDFSRFDEIDANEKARLREKAWRQVAAAQKRKRWLPWLIALGIAAAVALMLLFSASVEKRMETYVEPYQVQKMRLVLQEYLREQDAAQNGMPQVP